MSDFSFQIVGDASEANKAVDGVTGRLDALNKRAEQSTKILSNKLRDIGKGMAFGLAADALNSLKGSLDGTSAAALSAGASGAAMGATFAGPWGAAIGGAIGLTKGLVSGLIDSNRAAEEAKKKLEEQAKAYWDAAKAAEHKKQIEQDLAPVLRDLAKAEKEAAEAAEIRSGILDGQANKLRNLSTATRAYQDALLGVGVVQSVGLDPLAGTGETQEEAERIRLKRQARDAELALKAATVSYGDVLLEVQGAENARNDRLEKLQALVVDQNISEKTRTAVLKEINKLYRENAGVLEKAKDVSSEWLKVIREIGTVSDVKITMGEQWQIAQRDHEAAVQAMIDAENREYQNVLDNQAAKIRAEEDWKRSVLRATDEAAKARQQVAEQERQAAEQVEQAWAQSLGSLASDALQGKQSLEELGFSFAKLALQMAAMQIGGPWGAFLGSFAGGLSLPGHASGTQFMVGGAGGTDQNIVAFRASNNERVTVETPEDVRTGKYFGGGGGGGPTYNTFVLQHDPRQIVSAMGTRAGKTQFVKLAHQFRR